MSFDSTIHAKALELARSGYEQTAAAGSGHPTTAASLAHIVAVLMYEHMRYEPANPSHPSSDRLVLSEGHAVPIIYAACADQGVMIGKQGAWRAMTNDDALTLREIDSVVDGHPNPIEGFPFFDAATGSLGQGLSVAAGLAVAAKLDKIDKRIFCIIGDGEAREGQIWEAADFIRDHGLSAVLPIFNCNEYAQSDVVSPQQSVETITKKLEAYGFEAVVIDGHNPTQIKDALSAHAQKMHDPTAAPIGLVAKTVKGWGSPSQQGHGHHGKPATGDDLTKALEELVETGKSLGAAADQSLALGLLPAQKPQTIEPTSVPAAFDAACEALGHQKLVEKGKCATRRAYGVALQALGRARADVVALDADVKGSTFAEFFSKDEALAERFVECRIAEQNMVSVAAGLSAGGKTPFCSTFGKFFVRAYDQIEMAVNSGANFKLVGSHSGISLAADGPSQMSLPDVAWFTAFSKMRLPSGAPGFYLLQPSDAFQAYALALAMIEHDGPCYMRTHRPDVEFLYGADHQFRLGGHEVLSKGRDLLIIASGYMVHQANRAMEKLDTQGVDCSLIDLYSIPFNEEAILDLANDNNGMILTLEDNYGAGMGGAIADACAASGDGFTVGQMYVRNLPKSGRSTDDVMAYCGLGVDDVVKEAMKLLNLGGA